MNFVTDIILGVGGILQSLIGVYIWVIIIAAVLSWVRPDPNNPIVQILYRLTEPAYKFVQRYIPTVFNGIDLTPIVIIVALQVVNVVLGSLLRSLAHAM